MLFHLTWLLGFLYYWQTIFLNSNCNHSYSDAWSYIFCKVLQKLQTRKVANFYVSNIYHMLHSPKISLFLFMMLKMKSRNLHILKNALSFGKLISMKSYSCLGKNLVLITQHTHLEMLWACWCVIMITNQLFVWTTFS